MLATATHCDICGRELDFDAPSRSRLSASVDHLIPLSKLKHLDAHAYRAMAVDPANLRAVHYGCNAARGNRSGDRPAPVLVTSAGSRGRYFTDEHGEPYRDANGRLQSWSRDWYGRGDGVPHPIPPGE